MNIFKNAFFLHRRHPSPGHSGNAIIWLINNHH